MTDHRDGVAHEVGHDDDPGVTEDELLFRAKEALRTRVDAPATGSSSPKSLRLTTTAQEEWYEGSRRSRPAMTSSVIATGPFQRTWLASGLDRTSPR